jgi:hypothetical protein
MNSSGLSSLPRRVRIASTSNVGQNVCFDPSMLSSNTRNSATFALRLNLAVK